MITSLHPIGVPGAALYVASAELFFALCDRARLRLLALLIAPALLQHAAEGAASG